ncbi:hypothetical protein [Clostridium butyricum]|uniref:hypothetical protein n=1 Tax=Clostridium butyricum TaxID=1492 RepID=UPI0022DFA724|nr:hypothetical protein [Clostridium butyricum]
MIYILNKKITLSTALYLCAYCVYLSVRILDYSMIEVPKIIIIFSRLFMAISIIIKLFVFDGFSFKWILTFCILIAMSFIIKQNSGYLYILDLVILVFGAINVKFDYIIRIFFYTATFILIMITLLSQIGFVEDLTYLRDGSLRHSFGYIYPTDYVALIFYVILADIYTSLRLNRRLLIRSFIYLAISLITIKFCGSRLGSCSIIIAIFVSYYLKNRNVNKLCYIEKFFLKYSIPILAVISIAAVKLYIVHPENWILSYIDRVTSWRLYISKTGVLQYGYKLFGQYIEMRGSGGLSNSVDEYFYLDVSYINIALIYGTVVLTILCVVYTFFTRKQLKEKQIFIPGLLLIIAINSVIGQQLIDIAYNPFLLVFFANICILDKVRGAK